MRKIVLRFALLFSVTTIGCQSLWADETNLTLTVDSVTYSNVTFGRVTPYAVSIRHDTGIASIPLAKLSSELQKKFGYDPAKSAQYRTVELQADSRAQQADMERLRKNREKQQADERASQQMQQLSRDAKALIGEVDNVGAAGVFVFARWASDNNVPMELFVYSETPLVEILLTGYPNQSALASGDKIRCYATRQGTYTMKTPHPGLIIPRWVWIR